MTTEENAVPASPWRTRGLWLAALAGSAGFLLLLTLLIFANQRAVAARDIAAEWQIHTYQVMLEAERLQSALFDAQRSRRGYILNEGRDPEMIAPFRAALRRIPNHIAGLRQLTSDNDGQKPRIDRIEAETMQLVGRMDNLATATRQRSQTAQFGSAGVGEAGMNRVRADIAALVADEQRLLVVRTEASHIAEADVRQAARLLALFGVLLFAVALIAGVVAFRSAQRARQARTDAEVLARSREALEAAVASRTREITAANLALEGEIVRARTAEAQVRQMQKLESVGQLTGGIAHDFNNMLAIIIGSLDLALRRLEDPSGRVLKYLDNAMDGARRAATLTARLLAFSRQQALAPEPIDANQFVGSISELLRRTLGESVQIETVLAGGLWRAYADAGELENAIVNLAVNARDAMDGAGKLTIETANTHLDDTYAVDNADVAPGQYVVVCVTDTGGGMPQAVIDKAFDPFFTTKSVGKGTGLGLSQVFGFVKQSGGHVKIYSEEGRGTTVKLYLPRFTGANVPERVEQAIGEMPRAQNSEVVLVVEDEERVRLITVDTLRELGYTVVHAGNGEEALATLESQPRVDLLFTDIVMPGMNGRELADAAQAARDGIKVLYTTGYTKNAVVHNGMLDAQVAFLPKPFTVAALAAKVRQVLDGGGINRPV